MITGTGVHDRPESAFTIDWNECSRSTGIGVHDPPERALSQEQLNIPQAEAEQMVQPDSVADGLDGEPVAVVGIGWRLPAASLASLRGYGQAWLP